MTDVLILACDKPARPRGLLEAVGKFRAAGHRVTIVTAAELSPAIQRVVTVVEVNGGVPFWPAFEESAAAKRAAARAGLIVALDHHAVHTAWQLAQRHPEPPVVLGIAPALREMTTEVDWKRALKSHGKRVARQLTGPRSQRTWALRIAYRTAITFAPMPSGVRLRLADRIADSLTRVQRGEQAARITVAAARALPAPRRAGYLTRRALAQVQAGRVPGFLHEAVTTELAASDRALQAGDVLEATRSYRRASAVLLHRAVHLDSLSSPLAEDPAAFVAPLRRSAVGRALTAPRGRTGTPDRGNRRILFMYFWNHNFVDPIMRRYEQDPDREVRTLDIGQDEFLGAALRQQEELVRDVAGGTRDYIDRVEAILRPHLDWADTIFVDWCTVTPAVLTLIDPGRTRIMVRLHSVEAFTEWPHLIDFSRVDDLVFVSEHLRDLVHRTIPELTAAGAPRSVVLTNAMELRRFDRPKTPGARFTLGLVGVNAVAKDPMWGVEVLRLLREHDHRYRLVLIGDDRPRPRTAPERNYFRGLGTALDELTEVGAVRRLGPTDDVPAALTEVGVILSTSVRESFHCGLAEGAAGGAVPVVRDWPFFAKRERGARTLFPAGWVVGSPAEAVARILAVTADEETWLREGAAAREHAVGAWDWPVVAPSYDRAMLGAG